MTIEGLDFLADLKGKGKEIRLLTRQAMDGNLSMREVMEIKIKVISPSYNDLIKMGKAYIENVTQGAKRTISFLKRNGLNV